MKLNKTDEKILKLFIETKNKENFIYYDKLKIPHSISNNQFENSLTVLTKIGYIRSLGDDYVYLIEPEGLRYFDEKKSNYKSLIFWKFIYPIIAFLLGGLVNQFLFH